MTAAVRLRTAEACAAVIVLSMFLPWTSKAGDSVVGLQVGEGQLMLLVGLGIVVLNRFGNRASWIAAGFGAAVMWRQALAPADGADVGIGLRVGALAATVAMVLLVWNMFAEVQASRSDRGA